MNISHAQDADLTLNENFNYITLNTALQKSDVDNNDQLKSTNLNEIHTNEEASHYILGYN